MKASASNEAAAGGTLGRLLLAATAIAFGGMLASLALFESRPGGLFLRFHWAAIPLFVGGCLAAWIFWRALWHFTASEDAPSRRRLKRIVGGLFLMAFGAFFYPVRFIDPAKRTDFLIGMSIAFVVLGIAGTMWWFAVRLFDREGPKDGEAE
jgi:hypothetical protein